MVEPIESVSPVPLFDVTRIAALRKRLGQASTALKVIGFLSALILVSRLHFGSVFEIVVALLTLVCASLIATGLRSGQTWAVGLAAIWSALFAAVTILDTPQNFGRSMAWVLGGIMLYTLLYFPARGTIAFAVDRVRRPQDRMAAGPLALNPYEEGLPIKRRPRFINKKAIAAYGLLILSPLPFVFMWAGQLALGVQSYESYAELVGSWSAYTIFYLVLVGWCTRIYRRARRAAMVPGSALIEQDTRPSVLYLRSFQDDTGIKVRARASNGRILPERLLKISFEEVVTDHLWAYGPVLAIGDPRAKSKATLLGAARDYADDSTWQQKVIERIQDAAMIVVVAGGTEGLAWEIDTIARLGSLWKLVLLLPPVSLPELRARWQTLASHASSVLPAQIDCTRGRAVIFPNGGVALIVGDKGNDWTYEAVLDDAALMIERERNAAHQTAANLQPVLRPLFGSVASDLATMMTSVLLLFLALIVSGGYQAFPPHASSENRALRDSFVAERMEICRQVNPGLSAERAAKYCKCFASDLADAVTRAEINYPKSKALKAKEESIANACYTAKRVAEYQTEQADTQAHQLADTKERFQQAQQLADIKAEVERLRATARDPARSVTPGSGKTFQDRLADGNPCPMCPEMVVVPAGGFMMGSTPSEIAALTKELPINAVWWKVEGPQHEVTIAQPFAVGRYAVTFAEWDACVADGGCEGQLPASLGKPAPAGRDEKWGRGTLPVINVSWDDAKAYAGWLSRKTGKSYRLLSEAEREYATRAGTTTAFWWGSSISTSQANYNGNAGGAKGEFRGKTVPVDSFSPNPWGLYNVHGNVWEWVEDCGRDTYQGARSDGSAWTTACTDASRRVVRGGSWFNIPQDLRAASRLGFTTSYRVYFLGFRMARTLNP
jgi:formylglycine-generating enzyme required for sulfatase activity